MTLEIFSIYAVAACLLIGGAFAIIGTIGLLRFNDSMVRLHAPTKVGTIGIGALLLASIGHSYVFAEGSLHELLIMAFLFVTAPISANFIAKVHIHRRACDTPPKPIEDETWSTLNLPEADEKLLESTRP
ncbi:monovalent cation/H(+) antiporter subunit G [Sulfitobacter sp. JB4-11]|uniref:monovalent cation/H(+) antiporter subunit G n=1 Tax=Sulfitobacter rhodophyticola TaxID=3238304 RepID=UPI0035119276